MSFFGAGWGGVLWCGLKLATRCVGSGDSWEGLQCRPSSAAICAQLGATWWELQSDVWLAATCAGPGGARERLCCELRAAAPGVRLGTIWQAPQWELRPAASCTRSEITYLKLHFRLTVATAYTKLGAT